MPRFHGYRERLNFNAWDCFSPRQLRDGEVKLFAQVRNTFLSNVESSNCLSSDQTTFIDNWYARTNIDTSCRPELQQAIAAWASMSTVTLVLGCRPIIQRPLDDLLAPRRVGDMAGHAGKTPISTALDAAETVAQKLFEQFGETTTGPNWFSLTEDERQSYRDRARSVVAKLGPRSIPVIVPVRQNVWVTITSEPRSLGALLEVMPTNIAPQALFWIHLAGVQTRDVA